MLRSAFVLAGLCVLAGCGGSSRVTTLAPPTEGNRPPDTATIVVPPAESAPQDSGEPTTIEASAPPAVRGSGGTLLAEFEAGRTAVAQSGCLACHTIGASGNRGPGPDLTRVGSLLSRTRIERAVIRPTEPMPSFKNLPRAKLRDLIVFLSLLRG